MNRDRALDAVRPIYDALRPACEKLVIAGSLRRGKENVKDVELCALPLFDPAPASLDFGLEEDTAQETEATARLDAALLALIDAGLLRWDDAVKRRGALYRRFVLPACEETPLELFSARRGNWGNTLAIRTGPAEFNRYLVTQRRKGGWMPNDLRQHEGFLERRVRGGRGCPETWARVECLTEAAYFEALRLPNLLPVARTVEAMEHALKQQRSAA